MTPEQIQQEREAEWRDEDKEFYHWTDCVQTVDTEKLERQGLEKLYRNQSGV